MKNLGTDEALGLFTFVAAIAFMLFVALIFAGCGGSNIPIDPVCEDLLSYQAEERAEFGCELEPVVCDDCDLARSEAYEEGYAAGYQQGKDDAVCVVVDRYNDGWEDGYEVGKYACEREAPAWTCDDFEDGRPDGHKPIECRGRGKDKYSGQVCRTVCKYSHLYGRMVCTTQCQETYS